MGQSQAVDGKRVAEFNLRWINHLDTLHGECRLSGTQVQLLSFCDETGQVQSRSWLCRPSRVLAHGLLHGKGRCNAEESGNLQYVSSSPNILVNETIVKALV